jgi:hypothetical protein
VLASIQQYFANENQALRLHATPGFSHSPTPPCAPSFIINTPQQSSLTWQSFVPGANVPKKVSECGQLPIDALPSNICVPSVPRGVALADGWRYWVKDWEFADPVQVSMSHFVIGIQIGTLGKQG